MAVLLNHPHGKEAWCLAHRHVCALYEMTQHLLVDGVHACIFGVGLCSLWVG